MGNKCSEKTILCECGHSLNAHSCGAGKCYISIRKTERRKNHLGKYIKVKCNYTCYCDKFEIMGEKDGI
jgi:hypothetical protein